MEVEAEAKAEAGRRWGRRWRRQRRRWRLGWRLAPVKRVEGCMPEKMRRCRGWIFTLLTELPSGSLQRAARGVPFTPVLQPMLRMLQLPPRYGPSPLTRNLETTKCPAQPLGPQPLGRLTQGTLLRRGGIGSSRRRSSARPRTKGLPKQVSSLVHCRTPPRMPATAAPPHRCNRCTPAHRHHLRNCRPDARA